MPMPGLEDMRKAYRSREGWPSLLSYGFLYGGENTRAHVRHVMLLLRLLHERRALPGSCFLDHKIIDSQPRHNLLGVCLACPRHRCLLLLGKDLLLSLLLHGSYGKLAGATRSLLEKSQGLRSFILLPQRPLPQIHWLDVPGVRVCVHWLCTFQPQKFS